MGGSIAVTIIKPNGEALKMSRWTNTLPSFLHTMDLINKNEKHINDYVNQWLEMKKDYEKNGPNGPFKYEMTNVYFPYNLMAPDGYGLVIVDMQKNKIYSYQGYCGIDVTHEPKLYPDRMKAWEILKMEGRIKIEHDFGDRMNLYRIDLSPFEVYDFEGRNGGGIEAMYEVIKKEYDLTPIEVKQWKEFME